MIIQKCYPTEYLHKIFFELLRYLTIKRKQKLNFHNVMQAHHVSELHASCTVSITIRHKSLIKFRKIKFFSVLKKTGSYSRNKIFSSVMRWHR